MTRHDHTKHSMQGSHEHSIVEIVVSAFWCVFKDQFQQLCIQDHNAAVGWGGGGGVGFGTLLEQRCPHLAGPFVARRTRGRNGTDL
jgi:hypothetical protein